MRACEPASFWWENEIDRFQRECCTRDSNKSSNARSYTFSYKAFRSVYSNLKVSIDTKYLMKNFMLFYTDASLTAK